MRRLRPALDRISSRPVSFGACCTSLPSVKRADIGCDRRMIALAALRTRPRLQGGVLFSGEVNQAFSAARRVAFMHRKSASEESKNFNGLIFIHISLDLRIDKTDKTEPASVTTLGAINVSLVPPNTIACNSSVIIRWITSHSGAARRCPTRTCIC